MTPSAVACIATLLFATTLPSVANASFPYKYDWSRFPGIASFCFDLRAHAFLTICITLRSCLVWRQLDKL